MSLRDLVSVLPAEYMFKLLDTRPNLVDWKKISRESKLSEEFIEEHKDKIDWEFISGYQDLSDEFREKWKKYFSKAGR